MTKGIMIQPYGISRIVIKKRTLKEGQYKTDPYIQTTQTQYVVNIFRLCFLKRNQFQAIIE